MVTTVTEAGTVRTVDLGVAAPTRATFSAGQLADGRLLIQAGDTLLRTTDGSWRQVARVDLTGVAARREMGALSIRSIAETVCLVPTSTLDGSSTPSEINCTDDGETWNPVDLIP